MKNERILILGATGFVGKKLIPKLAEIYGDEALIKWGSDFDIREDKIIASITHENPSIIIHAAGKSFVPDSWKYPNDFYTINTLGTINVAEAARISGAKIIFLSTFVYGAPYSLPISETDSAQPFNPYASSKFLAEQLLKNYFEFFGVESNVLRVFNVYGDGQQDDFLIPTIISQYKNFGSIHVKDIKPKRDYIHVDDLTDAIVAASKKINGFSVYNVASGESHSVADIIEYVHQAGGKEVPVISDNLSRENEVMDTRADISKIMNELNWIPKIKIREGIKRLFLSEKKST